MCSPRLLTLLRRSLILLGLTTAHGTTTPTGQRVSAQISPGVILGVLSWATAKVMIGVTPQDGTVTVSIFRAPRSILTTPGHMGLAKTTEITLFLEYNSLLRSSSGGPL